MKNIEGMDRRKYGINNTHGMDIEWREYKWNINYHLQIFIY